MTTGNELRQQYLDFFASRAGSEHRIVAPAPLVPPDDPTLMFTSAGMVQFKSLYSGAIDPLPYSRAASCQPCLRAGGKGSDLENVGKTLRHHTLFEMLGNFSFGDYFKREAIRWAWEFVTEVMKLKTDRLFPTIFLDDPEAATIWAEETGAHYPPVRLGAKENFWGPAGETGACGPCSELCYFMGTDEELAEIKALFAKSEEDALKLLSERIENEGDLFLEIWNMVFPQFDQQRDGTRLTLKNRGIDTGAGLERMTTVMLWQQGKAATPYETDLLWPITTAAAQLVGVNYVRLLDDPTRAHAAARLGVNAIADHARALCFCLSEGITPGNIGRGYVIRRIQRRALRFASLLGQQEPFMEQLVDPVIEAMGNAYPQLKVQAEFVKKALRIEEASFLKTRNRGMKLLDEVIDSAKASGGGMLSGTEAFKLWDTYGFPKDMTKEIAEDEGLRFDEAGYNEALSEQKERSRDDWKGQQGGAAKERLEELEAQYGETTFRGYKSTKLQGATVLALLTPEGLVEFAKEGDKISVILNATSFYAESGGQIGDTGVIVGQAGEKLFEVEDTQKTEKSLFLHHGVVAGRTLRVGDSVDCLVDEKKRLATRRNHSSTHLLQAALKKHVGSHTSQAGSFCGPEGLRFDFTHPEGIAQETLRKIQEEVNTFILRDEPIETEVLPLDEARSMGAIAPFGEKYGATVRVVEMGRGDQRVSLEFCGGIHLDRTSQAGHFRIVSEGSVAAGIRRIEAVTGEKAVALELEEQYGVVNPLQLALASKGTAVVERVEQLTARIKQLEKQLAQEKSKAATANLDQFVEQAIELNGNKIALAIVPELGANELRSLASALVQKLGPNGIAIAATESDDKKQFVVACGDSAKTSLPAGAVVNKVAAVFGGKGGGKPEMAQAGAKSELNLSESLKDLAAILS
ncbi:MAG: alanine--tRNA ligase [Sumerlaeia bacterium]